MTCQIRDGSYQLEIFDDEIASDQQPEVYHHLLNSNYYWRQNTSIDIEELKQINCADIKTHNLLQNIIAQHEVT